MARSANSFKRPKPRFKPQARVLVLCEDSKSCLQYLKDAARHFRSYAEVEIAHIGTDPRNIVQEAINRKRNFDTVYCAFDRDRHERFDEALTLAAANTDKVVVIASYPCYEFWLLLHFGRTRKPYSGVGSNSAGDLLVRDLCQREGMGGYDKGNSQALFERLLSKLPDARNWSAAVLAEAIDVNELNPSTRLHELIARFEELGTPQPKI
jgi:RloB-like protein